jgi:cytochrome c-type biogenesis protein CcmH
LTRRTFLAAVLAGGGGVLLTRKGGFGQTPQRPDSENRLYDPSMVQERSAATATDNDAVIKELEHRLKCTCGCNLDIYTCRTTDFTCSYSPSLHREVMALRAAGKTPEEVVTAFVAKYGEQILMAPRPEGFNLAGYLLPGAVVLTAAGVLAALLLRRGRQSTAAPEAFATAGPASSPADAERLQRALDEVED